MNSKKLGVAPRIGEAAVRSRTGKTWEEWFSILDRSGAGSMDHRAIAAILKKLGVGPWWQQMVAVSYEQARGLRKKHQRPEGYRISVSKTIRATLDDLHRAWTEPRSRKAWLSEAMAVRKAAPGKSMRAAWPDGTRLEVDFHGKGPGKSQVTVQHGRLRSPAEAERMKAFWADGLDRLKASLENS